ncbi:MAG: hypothetical protein IJE26_03445, partial [Oscillospiraceae bacterium]|nr:hypothetical protein [Oscillospiraceae bacterium]
YMDALERLDTRRKEYDVDVLLLYKESDSLKTVAAKQRRLMEAGESVMLQRCIPDNVRYKRLCEVSE